MKSMIAKYKWWIVGAAVLVVGYYAFRYFKKDTDDAAASTEKPALLDTDSEQGLSSNEEIRKSILRNDIIGALN